MTYDTRRMKLHLIRCRKCEPASIFGARLLVTVTRRSADRLAAAHQERYPHHRPIIFGRLVTRGYFAQGGRI